jgi:hypothetical protein
MLKLIQRKGFDYRQFPLLVALFITAASSTVQAQPAGNRAIEEAEVESLNGCSRVTVSFVFPVQFLSQFPEQSGTELRVQFRPLATGSSNTLAVFTNEPIRLMDDTGVNLTRFEYVGDRPGTDPYLWLISPDTFYFRAQQGEDFRSLVIYISPSPLADCGI